LLLPLLFQERTLLESYGPEHPEVRAVRARIAVVRDFISQHAAGAPPEPVRPAAATIPAPVPDTAREKPADPQPIVMPVVQQLPAMPAAEPEPGGAAAGFLVQLIGILVALVVVLLVQVVALLIVLRRWTAKLTPQVRVELVHVPGGLRSEPVAGEVVSQRVYLNTPGPRGPDLMNLDLGPGYRDQVRAMGEAELKEDQAVFKQILEDNLRMQKQISDEPV
jgi:hypothetical protein